MPAQAIGTELMRSRNTQTTQPGTAYCLSTVRTRRLASPLGPAAGPRHTVAVSSGMTLGKAAGVRAWRGSCRQQQDQRPVDARDGRGASAAVPSTLSAAGRLALCRCFARNFSI